MFVKRDGETAPSLPERRFWAAILLNDDVSVYNRIRDDDDSRNNDGARKCNLDHARRVLLASLVAQVRGILYYNLSMSAACMEDQV